MLSLNLKAQEVLRFDRRFVHCINRWVAFGYGKKDSTVAYGFVYANSPQSISLRYMGTIKLDSNGHFVPNHKIDSLGAMVTYRLSPEQNRKIVGIIPKERLKEIGVEEYPSEYKFYTNDTTSVTGLYNRGFLFNAWGECKDALNYLLKANKINANYEGLAVELAYSYNCLKQFDNAAEILKDALKNSPDNCYFYKELAYSLQHSKKMSEAEEITVKASKICNDNDIKCEMAYNLAADFLNLKDKMKFALWLKKAREIPTNNKQIIDGIKVMEEDLKKM
jgi:tetratricopeptide (TPR) repeat protein